MIGVQDFVQGVIKESNICIMHFLESSTQTFKTLQSSCRYDRPVETSLKGTRVLYSQGAREDYGIYFWGKEDLESFISESEGHILSLSSSEAIEGLGEKIKILADI